MIDNVHDSINTSQTYTKRPTVNKSVLFLVMAPGSQIPTTTLGIHEPWLSALKTECNEALNLTRVVAQLKWGGERDTLLILYQAIVRSKLDYDVLCMAQHQIPNVRLLGSIHNAELRLALGAYYTSPVSSMYTEANEAPLEERCLKLLMHCYLKTHACTDNWAHNSLHEFDPTTGELYLPRPNGRGGMPDLEPKPLVSSL